MLHNVYSIPCSLETVCNTFEKIGEVWISNDFLKFLYQISIEFWITNTLLHSFFFQAGIGPNQNILITLITDIRFRSELSCI